MSVHVRILSRTLTTEYYRANAMFFLVVLGLCFGFMSGKEHAALAGFFVSSLWLTLIPITAWVVYTLKVIAYNKVEVRNERNAFLYSLPMIGGWLPCIMVAIGELAPAIIYGSFLGLFALQAQQVLAFLAITISLPVLIFTTVIFLHRNLLQPAKEQSTPKPVRWLDRRFAKRGTWILTEGILRSQPGLIFTVKFAGCSIIYGVAQLYLYDIYDERLYLMAACAIFSANLSVVYQYQRFEVAQLLLMRSLPLSFGRRVGTFAGTMFILCFPEIAILATNLPSHIGVQSYVSAVLFGFSLLLFGYGALYVRDATFDDFTRWIFFVTMGLLLLILFSVPVWTLSIAQLALGIYLLHRNFYSFEIDT
jgi:hypothetical protein